MKILLNHWQINLLENTIENTETQQLHKIEPRSMAVLKLLIDNQNQVVSRDMFSADIWQGRVTVDESLTRCISELRKVLELDTKKPQYIKTIHKKGYKLLVEPQILNEANSSLSQPPPSLKTNKFKFASFAALVGVILVLALTFKDSILHLADSESDSQRQTQNDLNTIRVTLLDAAPKPSVLTWRNSASDTDFTIKSSQLLESESGELKRYLQLVDNYEFVIWEASSIEDNQSDWIASVEALIEVMRLLELHKEAPEMALLPLPLRSDYKRARYLIDLRGQENLEEAVTLLDGILAQRPDLVMVLIEKAVAARMMTFYMKTPQLREQQAIQYELLIKQAAVIEPDHPVVKSLKGKLDLEQKNWYEYETLLTEAVEYAPACIICVRNLAEHYLNLGFYQKAETLVKRHLDYFPLSIMMQSFLGQIYNMQGITAGARHQVNVVNALGHTHGSDTLAMEINIAMSEGDSLTLRTLMTEMVKKHPAYEAHRAATIAQIEGDYEAFKDIVERMPRLDFNMAVATENYPDLIVRINRNISSGNLRDLRLIHGWLNPETHISQSYIVGLLNLKNRPEITELFQQIGLFDYWSEFSQWPDYCVFDQFDNHRPDFCPQ